MVATTVRADNSTRDLGGLPQLGKLGSLSIEHSSFGVARLALEGDDGRP